MNIQAEDEKWYIDPAWDDDNFRISTDEDPILCYKGRVLWSTARRVLRPLGIKAKLDIVRPDSHLILSNHIILCSAFRLSLRAPIPVPPKHEGFFDEAPNPLHCGKTLSWKLSGKRWIPIGPTS